MTQTAHTPGPLLARKRFVITPGGASVAFCFGSPNLPSSQATANACLFAAAPDLLAACDAFLALWPGVHDGSRPAHPEVRVAVNATRAAIAKARG